MSVIKDKLKEVFMSVAPITAIILLLYLIFSLAGADLPQRLLWRFLAGAPMVIAGLTIFLLGVDLGITPLGNHVGSGIFKSGKIWIIVAVGLVVGFFIMIAEPDLLVLAQQVAAVTSGAIGRMTLLSVVSLGMAVMLVAGLIHIARNFPAYILFAAVYGVIGLLGIFASGDFLAISFDASGATTGAMTVPFILALALGASSMKKDAKSAEKDSFGLVGITSTGAILGVLVMGVVTRRAFTDAPGDSVTQGALSMIRGVVWESALAILPIAVIFLVFQIAVLRLPKRHRRRILVGLIYTFIGLALFLTGVNIGFMDMGRALGRAAAQLCGKPLIVALGFVLGFVTIMAEPAVYVLTRQIDEVTAGYVRRRIVLGALAIGVGAAVGLSMLRILITGIQLWHFLLPGFGVSIILSFFTPKLFVGIAFDSGGVASGPMTATFILAFAQGVAGNAADTGLMSAFGMIAMVAMMPVVTLQILGIIFKIKSNHKGGARHEAV